MRDTLRLRRRFLLEVLTILPLALAAPACRSKTDGTLTHPEQHMPSCPSGKWCTTVERASSLADKDAPVSLGCADRVSWNRPDDGGLTAQDLPSMYGQGTHEGVDTLAERKKGNADACCYTWVEPCPGGRALRSGEGVALAARGTSAGWSSRHVAPPSELSSAARQALADAWLADALAEHASVASFARATLELMAVGAPAELVRACQAASLDEIEHARLAFAQASRFAGTVIAPGPLVCPPLRAPSLVQVAIDTFVEGCVGETLAALSAERARAAATDASICSTLDRIAHDEAAHAALAWRTVAWTVSEGGDEVRRALDAVAADVRQSLRGGISLEAWREVIEPTLCALMDQNRPARAA
jgi:hypothetical protein